MQAAVKRGGDELGDLRPATLSYLQSQLNRDGGFRGRSDSSDLYYSVFGMGGLLALGMNLECDLSERYLDGFTDIEELTFVALASLVRCWSYLPGNKPKEQLARECLKNIEEYRSSDGGYNHVDRGQEHGTVYGCFLALGAYQDIAGDMPDQRGLVACIESMEAENGGFANDCQMSSGSTPATAAALTVLHCLSEPIQNRWVEWLVSCHCKDGGFKAHAALPVPDLLSTATALHSLALVGGAVSSIREQCLDFVCSLRNQCGSFGGHWGDDQGDSEYTYYGLMALGYLSSFA